MSTSATIPATTPTARLGRIARPGTALVLLVLVLVTIAGWRAAVWWHLDRARSDGDAAVAVARAEVDGLISISSGTSQSDIDRLLGRATADFRSQLGQQSARLRSELAENAVTATGDVVSAGLVGLDGDHASVVVAAIGTVRNKSSKQAQPRSYRLKVELDRSGGTWLVSGLEFVS